MFVDEALGVPRTIGMVLCARPCKRHLRQDHLRNLQTGLPAVT